MKQVKEELTNNQLRDKLVKLGMTRKQVDAFKTKEQLLSVINVMSAQQAVASANTNEPKKVERVKTLVDRPSAGEKKVFARHYGKKARIMKEKLMKQPTTTLLVPIDPRKKPGIVEWRTDPKGEKYQVHISGEVLPVIANGFTWLVPMGRYVEVPKQVADIVSKAQQKTMKAGEEYLADRLDPATGKPVSAFLAR